MKLIRWLGKKVRGPFWYLWNILCACWFLSLRDAAAKPSQTPVKRPVFRLLITFEILLTGAFIYAVLQGMAQAVITALLVHFLYIELRLTWWRERWADPKWGAR